MPRQAEESKKRKNSYKNKSSNLARKKAMRAVQAKRHTGEIINAHINVNLNANVDAEGEVFEGEVFDVIEPVNSGNSDNNEIPREAELRSNSCRSLVRFEAPAQNVIIDGPVRHARYKRNMEGGVDQVDNIHSVTPTTATSVTTTTTVSTTTTTTTSTTTSAITTTTTTRSSARVAARARTVVTSEARDLLSDAVHVQNVIMDLNNDMNIDIDDVDNNVDDSIATLPQESNFFPAVDYNETLNFLLFGCIFAQIVNSVGK